MGNRNNGERIVVITGGARGIGMGIAKAFSDNGDQVMIFDLDKEAGDATASKLGNAFAYMVDITCEESVVAALTSVSQQHGVVDVLVNNAGIQFISPVEEFPYDQWQKLLGVMLSGPFLMTKHVVEGMKQQGWGRIINISSVHGMTASPYKSAYIAAKHGVIGLTRAVACETASQRVTANAILPGAVETELLRNQLGKIAEEEGISIEQALKQHILSKQPIDRLIDVGEVAGLALYLASEGAGGVTGEAIRVAGGWR
ncbi:MULTISPECIES: 3-hydroxybutyrate dehydrogenase [unclassified Halomonas]|uniref:3-hydroxybutyrate dehydrogenase n=1 Tax=unclassified Halomonas TaxID=2609666 RepID=UPI000487C546|nr:MULTISPECIES: 3-hydroxybutyrate dehydrogenase [unclassified Halomonas]PKH59444.1 3-hydroxybutyrate dehydrogenase [Halomonas sp. Choline-3u-9]QGQ70608.1 SDR family oxidoreductase [Halomonas sp. PA16-9]